MLQHHIKLYEDTHAAEKFVNDFVVVLGSTLQAVGGIAPICPPPLHGDASGCWIFHCFVNLRLAIYTLLCVVRTT